MPSRRKKRQPPPFDHDAHLRRLESAVALSEELVPERHLEAGEIHANFRDAALCNDRALAERTDKEAERRTAHHERMCSLLLDMRKAEALRNQSMSVTVHAMMIEEVRSEWNRRTVGGEVQI